MTEMMEHFREQMVGMPDALQKLDAFHNIHAENSWRKSIQVIYNLQKNLSM